jgi:hypothetical protein
MFQFLLLLLILILLLETINSRDSSNILRHLYSWLLLNILTIVPLLKCPHADGHELAFVVLLTNHVVEKWGLNS